MTQFPQTFQIHYFAAASSYTQRETESLPAPTPLSRLFPILEEKYPGIREKVLSSCSVALGGEYVDLDLDSGEGEGQGDGKDTVIAPGDEVAIIPPVSSG